MLSTQDAPVTLPDPPAPAERRAAVRFACHVESQCHAIPPGRAQAWWARVQNVSQTGVSLLLSRRFEPGSVLVVEPTGKSTELPRCLVVRVVHAAPQADGWWQLGCAFHGGLSESELAAMLAQGTSGRDESSGAGN